MEKITEILDYMKNVEKNDLHNRSEVIEWYQKISNPNFSIIKICTELLIENIEDAGLCKNLILIIKKLSIYCEKLIKPQLKNNLDICNSVILYIIVSDNDKICQEVIYILNDIFSDEYILDSDFYEDELIFKLLDFSKYIKKEELIFILIKLFSIIHFNDIYRKYIYSCDSKISNYKNDVMCKINMSDDANTVDICNILLKRKFLDTENIYNFLNDYYHNSNLNTNKTVDDNKNNSLCIISVFIKNLMLLKSINYETFKLILEYILKTLFSNICSKLEQLIIVILIIDLIISFNSSLFYKSDIEALLDYCINRLQTTSNEVIRDYILRLIILLIYSPGYNKNYFKKNVVQDTIECYLDSDEINDIQKIICNLILEELI